MNVMFVIRSMAYGGAQRQLCVLAQELILRGHLVTVAVFYGGESFEHLLRAAGVRVVDLQKKGRWDVVGFFVRLRRAIQQERPDVVHSYMATENILCTTTKWTGVHIPLVFGIRASNVTDGRLDWLMRLAFFLERICARSAQAVIFNSEAGRRHLGLSGRNQVTAVIANGIDTKYFRPDPAARKRMREQLGIAPEVPTIGLVARLDPMKDHRTFFRAAARVREQRPAVRVLCVGTNDPGYLSELQRFAAELDLEQSLTWIFNEPDMAALYNALDVLCLSSAYGEGFSNVLAEAMACGVPCVATDVGDAKRVLSEVDRLVPSKDPESLAVAILESFSKDDAAKELRIQRVRQHFSTAHLAARTEQILMGAITQGSRKLRVAERGPL